MQVLHAKRGDVAGGVSGYAGIQEEVRRQSGDTLLNFGGVYRLLHVQGREECAGELNFGRFEGGIRLCAGKKLD